MKSCSPNGPNIKVAVLGTGQLGMMLQDAAKRLGIALQLLDVNGGSLPTQEVLITYEREHFPDNPFIHALQEHPGWLNAKALVTLKDRIQQKQFLRELNLPTADWCIPSADLSQAALHQQLGPDIFLKRAQGGYDGKGQIRLRSSESMPLPDWLTEAIAEKAIPFNEEVSLIGARARDGQMVFYRLTRNFHHEGILFASLSDETYCGAFQTEAERIMKTIMTQLDYVGVMTIEFFIERNRLLINEIASRVHNSGHWTLSGASISQFELHVRAICGFPMPQPIQAGYTAMINLVGLPYQVEWLKHPAAQLTWYGKEYRPGRKLGHINFHGMTREKMSKWIAETQWPGEYGSAIQWIQACTLPEIKKN